MRYLATLSLASFLIVLTGCSEGIKRQTMKATTINVVVQNSSTNACWVKIDWEGPDVPVGILSVGMAATTVGYEWPYLPSAKIALVDDKTRQRYNTDVSFAAVNGKLKTGMFHQVTIRIMNYNEVSAACQ